jgi:thiamine biosynthesis lipoprotein
MEAIFAEVRRLEDLLSFFKPTSALSRVNQNAAAGPVTADPELIFLIGQSFRFAEKSQGAFDFTVAPLIRLWGFRDREPPPRPPAPEQIRKALESVGYGKLALDFDRSTLQYKSPGIEVELGAIGKGYAVDRAVDVLRSRGISRALVSFGSSAYAVGSPPSEDGWRIAIRDPRVAGSVIDRVVLKGSAIGTSGDYEQSVRLDGRDYGHLLDPRSGYPVEGMASVSVIASTAMEADALSTAAFVLGARSGMSLLEESSGVEGLIVGEENDRSFRFTSTKGWKAFRPNPVSTRELTRRRFLATLAAGLAGLLFYPRLGYPIVYLTREEAMQRLIPQAEEFQEDRVTLTAVQKERLQTILEKKVPEENYTFWIAKRAGAPIGYAVLLDVIGKERPITFMIAVGPEGRVIGVEVLIYRESQGSEIRSGRFIRQFIDKTLSAPLKLGRDVDAISGATLSSRSTAYAVKKALALVAVVYGKESSGSP